MVLTDLQFSVDVLESDVRVMRVAQTVVPAGEHFVAVLLQGVFSGKLAHAYHCRGAVRQLLINIIIYKSWFET